MIGIRKAIAISGIWAVCVGTALALWRLWPSPPNVVIILVDALRQDHLGCYGYSRDTTPFIDNIAKRGVMFENAYSQAASTKASVGSLFTSLYPTMHSAMWHTSEGREGDVLPPDVRTLAEALKDRGYFTVAVSSNPHITPEFGFAQGFEVFKYEYLMNQMAANRTALAALAHTRNRPFFLYLHYMSTHAPYDPPPPYDIRYAAPGKVPYYKDGIPDRPISAEELKYMIDRYDGGVAYADACIRDFFMRLEGAGLMKNTNVVILADHGEEFLEHGGLGHRGYPCEVLLKIPLIMFPPPKGAPVKKIAGLAATFDLYPTILEMAGAKYDPRFVCGRSLLPLVREGREVREEVFSEYYTYYKSLRDSTHRYNYPCTPDRREQLFDIVRDPNETRDLVAAEPALTARYRTRVEEWMTEMKEMAAGLGVISRRVTIDEKTRTSLKALGYIQ